MPKATAELMPDTDSKPKHPGGRPRKDSQKPIEYSKSILDAVAKVKEEDWGSRVQLYLYRTAPIIDRDRSGKPHFICVYEEPVTEDRIMADYGSGGYRLVLTFRKPGGDKGDQIDSGYLKIMNVKFPPKIPEGEWVDDNRNKEWEWAKQYFTGPKPQAESPTAQLKVLNDIRREVREEMTPSTDPVDALIEGMKLAREERPQRTAAEELASLATVAEKMRPPETVPQFMQVQFAALQAQINSAQESRDKLMMMLLAKKDGDANGFSLVKELFGGLKELMPEVKSLFPGLGEGDGGRTRMGGWQEFTVAMAPHVTPILAPFAQMFSQLLVFRMQTQMQQQPQQGPSPQPGQPPHPANPGLPPAGQPAMMPFLQMIAMPMLNYARDLADPQVKPDEAGEALAEWVHGGFGESPQYEQARLAARTMGPIGIIAAFRATPIWTDKGPRMDLPSLAELEPKLIPFFSAFLKWEPEPDEEPEPSDPAVPEVLTYHEGAEG